MDKVAIIQPTHLGTCCARCRCTGRCAAAGQGLRSSIPGTRRRGRSFTGSATTTTASSWWTTGVLSLPSYWSASCAGNHSIWSSPLISARRARSGTALRRLAGATVGLHPGSAHPGFRWPHDRFAAVADLLASRHGARILVTGTEQEAPLAAAVVRTMLDPGRVRGSTARSTRCSPSRWTPSPPRPESCWPVSAPDIPAASEDNEPNQT